MPMDKGKEAAIIMFAMPKKPGKGVTPPTESSKKMSVLPDMSEEGEYEEKPMQCEECEGEGCEECDMKGYVEHEDEGEYGAGAEDSHKKHMKIISKLVEMLDRE